MDAERARQTFQTYREWITTGNNAFVAPTVEMLLACRAAFILPLLGPGDKDVPFKIGNDSFTISFGFLNQTNEHFNDTHTLMNRNGEIAMAATIAGVTGIFLGRFDVDADGNPIIRFSPRWHGYAQLLNRFVDPRHNRQVVAYKSEVGDGPFDLPFNRLDSVNFQWVVRFSVFENASVRVMRGEM